MVQRIPPGLPQQGLDQRSHHISSIAHHFFGEPAEPPEKGKTPSVELTVSCGGPGPLAAWVSSRLVQSGLTDNVVLAESPDLAWTAASYLDGHQLSPVDPGDDLVGGGEHPTRFWQVASRQQGSSPADKVKPRLVVRNIGPLSKRLVVGLETVMATGHPAGVPWPEGGTLVWCLTPIQAPQMETAYALGRILGLFQPRHLEVMIIDEGGPSFPPSPGGSEHFMTNRCRQLVAAVAKGCPVNFSVIPTHKLEEPTHPLEIFQTVAKRVLNSD